MNSEEIITVLTLFGLFKLFLVGRRMRQMGLSEAYTEKPEMDWRDKMSFGYDCVKWQNVLFQVCESDEEKSQVEILFARIKNEISPYKVQA